MKFDEVLRNHVGEFGTYQRLLVTSVTLVCVLNAFYLLEIVVTSRTPDHWCKVPPGQPGTNMSQQQWLNESIPWEYKNGGWRRSQCYFYSKSINSSSQSTSPSRHEVRGTNTTSGEGKEQVDICSQHEFDPYSPSSIVSEWDLVCERRQLVSTIKSTLMAGLMTGAAVGGLLADRFGRRTVLLLAVVLTPIVRIGVMFPPHFVVLLVTYFLCDMSAGIVYVTSYTLAVELVGSQWRALVGTMCFLVYSAGIMWTALWAYILEERLYIQIALTLPALPFLIYFWTLPESPRWLYAKGRAAEGRAILEKFAKRNGTHLSRDVDVAIGYGGDNATDVKVWKLCSSVPLAIRAFLVTFAWFTVTFSYFGLTLNIGSLAGNIYLNLFITGTLEMVAYIGCYLALGSRLGRRVTNTVLYIVAGLTLLGTLAVPTHLPLVTTVLATVGRMCVAGAFNAIYIWTAEVFPTAVRTTALSTASWVGKIGGILAPLTENLIDYSPVIPPVIFGSLSLTCGLLLLILPETRNQPLPQTVADMKAQTSTDKSERVREPTDVIMAANRLIEPNKESGTAVAL